jgi:hypothetical protein
VTPGVAGIMSILGAFSFMNMMLGFLANVSVISWAASIFLIAIKPK